MKSSGTAMYYGTIPAGVIVNLDNIAYYVEALDYLDAVQETPWYSVSVKEAAVEKPVAAATPATAKPAVVSPAAPSEPESSNKGLITAGNHRRGSCGSGRWRGPLIGQ